jgi:Putative zinc-finger
VDHSRARELISERMDGEHLSSRARTALEQHLEACLECRSFERGAFALRERVRFAVAPAVPDLVETIVAEVERSGRARLRLVPPRASGTRLGTFAPAIAALVVGVIVGSLVVGGPLSRPQRQSAIAATEITHGIARAATELTSYDATFAITEDHLSAAVPVGELSMHVWFRAPGRFRLDVVDHSVYPNADTAPTDVQLVVNGSGWATSGPAPCGLTRCPDRRVVVRHGVPFSSDAPTATDLVLPVTTLSDTSSVRVLGTGTVLGRPAVELELPFERATPLFPFLQLGGTWRPFFPKDRVVLWLDRSDWFPLRWTVYPAAGRERDLWALRFGLPPEPARQPIFQVSALSFERTTPAPGTFRIPSSNDAEDAGAATTTLTHLPERAGFTPLTPSDVAGLDLYRVVLPPQGSDEAVITYSKGLTWLKLGETKSWSSDAPYGPVGPHAEQVALPGGGLGYYEPATQDQGRRLSIHAAGADLYLETNLSRRDLFRVAGSLPVRGISIAWTVQGSTAGSTERVGLEQAAQSVPFVLHVPTRLPNGYAFASAELVTLGDHVGVNLYFQQLDAELGVGPIRLHAERADRLPPASSATQATVTVGGIEGRWTPGRDQLEWIDGGVYYSLDASGLDLPTLLGVAASMAPLPSPSGATP